MEPYQKTTFSSSMGFSGPFQVSTGGPFGIPAKTARKGQARFSSAEEKGSSVSGAGPGTPLKCEFCGTLTDQYWKADFSLQTCRCYSCEKAGVTGVSSEILPSELLEHLIVKKEQVHRSLLLRLTSRRAKKSEIETLVPTHISQHKRIDLYPKSAKVVRESTGITRVGGGVRGEIDSFSWGSKRRLSRTAENAFPAIKTTFALTYHNEQPDGKTVKQHLNTFFTSFRRTFKGASYLWVLEFQKRGIPHFHVYTSLKHDLPKLNEWIGATWNRIAEPESISHLKWHQHRTNCRPWTMENGNYLTKYLDKHAQKMVPDGFGWVGRFWGASRGIVPEPISITKAEFKQCYDRTETDFVTGALTEFDSWSFLTRTLRRHWESTYRKRGMKPPRYPISWYRKGFHLFKQVENYLSRQNRQEVIPF